MFLQSEVCNSVLKNIATWHTATLWKMDLAREMYVASDWPTPHSSPCGEEGDETIQYVVLSYAVTVATDLD
jgi:hypothetical protein